MKIQLTLIPGDSRVRAINSIRKMLGCGAGDGFGLKEAKAIADQVYVAWAGKTYIITDTAFGRMKALELADGQAGLGFSYTAVSIVPELDNSVIDLTR